MNYVKVKILPTPHNIEFKRVGRLIFDINYVEYLNISGLTVYWLNSKGQCHRENGPAVIRVGGEQYWSRYGDPHREDGPAIILSDGSQFWYLNGIKYSEKDFKKAIRRRNELRKSKNLTETPQC